MARSAVVCALLMCATVAADRTSDLAGWELDGNGVWTMRGDVLVLEKAGVPTGSIRRPAALAIRKGEPLSDVMLQVDVRSTAPAELAVRDVLLIVGYQSPTRFYYVHLSAKTDAVHNGIFLVDNADRRRIDDGKGIARLTDQQWHRVRLERRSATGEIRVFYGEETTPALVAADRTIVSGRVGVGSFDETAEFRAFSVSPPPSMLGYQMDERASRTRQVSTARAPHAAS